MVVLGVGKVGSALARHLHEAGARLTLADVRADVVGPLAAELGAAVVDVGVPQPPPSATSSRPAPWAPSSTRPRSRALRCAAVCGAANNQLATDDDGRRVGEHGVLYAPDYVVNAGGVINIADETAEGGYDQPRAYARVATIATTLERIFTLADERGISTAPLPTSSRSSGCEVSRVGPVDDAQPADQPADPEELSRIYRHRFDEGDREAQDVLWRTLCESFFQQYVDPTDTVLDLGAGSCQFVNNIKAARKIAVDLNPDTKAAAVDAEVLQTSSEDLSAVADGTVDVVFTSNFFEHLPDKGSLLRTLTEVRRVLRPGGHLVVLMPNLRYLGGRYWDYLDHHLPLTHASLAEGIELTGLTVERVEPKFLPYTVKSRLPTNAALIRLYLKVPLAWKVLGSRCSSAREVARRSASRASAATDGREQRRRSP